MEGAGADGRWGSHMDVVSMVYVDLADTIPLNLLHGLSAPVAPHFGGQFPFALSVGDP